MTKQAIDALVVYYNGRDQKGRVYGRIKRTRYGTIKYVSVIRRSKKKDDADDGFVRQYFERDTPEEATEAVKEGLRKQVGLWTDPALVPKPGDEDIDLKMILRDRRESGTKIGMHKCHDIGYRILRKMEELDLNYDPCEEIFILLESKRVLLGPEIARFVTEDVPPPKVPPKVANRTQRHMAKYVLNFLIAKFGAETSVQDLAAKRRAELLEFYRDEIVNVGELKLSKSYRAAARRYWRRFFKACWELHLIRLPSSMFEERTLGAAPPVLLPKAEVLWKFLHTIITKHIELLPFVVLQLCMALRPEEAWAALGDPMQYIMGSRLHLRATPGVTKQQTVIDRNVYIRPLTWWLLHLIPGLLDRTVKEFRIPNPNAKPDAVKPEDKYYDVTYMMDWMNGVLRESGFDPEGSMPDELLRKVCLTSLKACGVPDKCVRQEAGHSSTGNLRFYIDKSWNRGDGLAVWSMRFEGQPAYGSDDFEWYRAYGQRRPKAGKAAQLSLSQAKPKTSGTPPQSSPQTPILFGADQPENTSTQYGQTIQ